MQLRIENKIIYVTVIVTIKLNTKHISIFHSHTIPSNVCCRLLIYVYPLWLHLNDQDDEMSLIEGALEWFFFSMVLFMYS